jgi:hypothetical protein
MLILCNGLLFRFLFYTLLVSSNLISRVLYSNRRPPTVHLHSLLSIFHMREKEILGYYNKITK